MAWLDDDISKILNRSYDSIKNKAYELKLTKNTVWSTEEIEILKKFYDSRVDLTKLLNRSYKSINLKACRLGIKKSENNYTGKYFCNSYFFSKPDILNSYWAGFIAADGCIVDDRRLTIQLQATDIDHLNRFKDDIMFEGNIISCNGRTTINGYYTKPSVKISISDSQIINDLFINYNIQPRKSLVLKPPILSLDNSFAYIIGYTDGDGCIRNRREHILNKKKIDLSYKLVGTYEVLFWVKNIFDKFILKYTSSQIKKYHKSIYEYVLTGNSARCVFSYLKNIDCPKLNRKWYYNVIR